MHMSRAEKELERWRGSPGYAYGRRGLDLDHSGSHAGNGSGTGRPLLHVQSVATETADWGRGRSRNYSESSLGVFRGHLAECDHGWVCGWSGCGCLH